MLAKAITVAVLALFFAAAAAWNAAASTLSRAAVAAYFPAPFVVGERDAKLPLWPIFKQNATSNELIAYAFESDDFAPVPGFSGTPVNLLIAVTPRGKFLDVRVVSQHEPVFVDGLGPKPLFRFVRQYVGKSLSQSIKIVVPGHRDPGADALAVQIDGVAKATASIRIINETILNSALQVARARLGFSAGRDPSRVAQIRQDVFEPLTFAQMLQRGYVRRLQLTNADVEHLFHKSDGEGLDKAALARPAATDVDVYIAELDVPIIGRNLLGAAVWRKLMRDLNGAPAMMALTTGRWTFMPDSFIRGSTPDLLAFRQGNAPVVLRDFAWDGKLAVPDAPKGDLSVLRIAPQTAFDPASPSQLVLRIIRKKGQFYPEVIARDVTLAYGLPPNLFIPPPPAQDRGIRAIWLDRASDLAILGASLCLLTFALFQQKRLVQQPRLFYFFRMGFLAFTLGFIGWWAQAQLSIVWLIGAAKALFHGGNLTFMLYDPPTLVVLAFTIIALFIWGRGTFCGWLCPFGAMQEFTGELGRLLRLPQWNLPARYEKLARLPKFVILAAVVGAALSSSPLAEKLAEVEPFKTAITLAFVRSAPFVAYAGLLLFISAFHYKFFCRYMCPLGAALAAGGLLRRWNWLERRKECGSPCQLCKVKCRYGAIKKAGDIVYSECFQCLECVAIHEDPKQCVPLVLQNRRVQRAAFQPAEVQR